LKIEHWKLWYWLRQLRNES